MEPPGQMLLSGNGRRTSPSSTSDQSCWPKIEQPGRRDHRRGASTTSNAVLRARASVRSATCCSSPSTTRRGGEHFSNVVAAMLAKLGARSIAPNRQQRIPRTQQQEMFIDHMGIASDSTGKVAATVINLLGHTSTTEYVRFFRRLSLVNNCRLERLAAGEEAGRGVAATAGEQVLTGFDDDQAH